jgi:hypothetical protein
MVGERGRDEKSNMQIVEEGWKMKCEITTGLSSQRASNFRYMRKTISIPEDIGHQCDWRTCCGRLGILDASRKFRRKSSATLGFLSGVIAFCGLLFCD